MPEDDAVTVPGQPVLYGRYASPLVRRGDAAALRHRLSPRPLMPFGPDKAALAATLPEPKTPVNELT